MNWKYHVGYTLHLCRSKGEKKQLCFTTVFIAVFDLHDGVVRWYNGDMWYFVYIEWMNFMIYCSLLWMNEIKWEYTKASMIEQIKWNEWWNKCNEKEIENENEWMNETNEACMSEYKTYKNTSESINEYKTSPSQIMRVRRALHHHALYAHAWFQK